MRNWSVSHSTQRKLSWTPFRRGRVYHVDRILQTIVRSAFLLESVVFQIHKLQLLYISCSSWKSIDPLGSWPWTGVEKRLLNLQWNMWNGSVNVQSLYRCSLWINELPVHQNKCSGGAQIRPSRFVRSTFLLYYFLTENSVLGSCFFASIFFELHVPSVISNGSGCWNQLAVLLRVIVFTITWLGILRGPLTKSSS